ncbi:prepilin peptidase [Porphyrobacter sp. AAP82]|uniref:prepilin peptidase n=1 Tax=Porphyrobacter sp. AAP82 TaxID=1248917 RepID=UPI00068733C3|nr:A24 family peptidase [Porphyrobacter sp. AAP82]
MIQVLLIASALVLMGIMAWSDARSFLLPLVPNIIFLVAGLIVGHLAFGISIGSALIGAGAGYLGLSAVAVAYQNLRGREGMGGGDPILLGGIGAWLGWQVLPTILLFAALFGLAYAVLQRLFEPQRIDWQDQRIPLGSCLICAALPAGATLLIAGG